MKVIKLDSQTKSKLLEMEMPDDFINSYLQMDFLVIEEKNGKFIGVTGVGGLFHKGGLFVKKEYRGTGIGSKLNEFRGKEIKRRNYSFFIGTINSENQNVKELTKIMKNRNARPVFTFSFNEKSHITLFIQEFNIKGKIVGRFLDFFNCKVGTFFLALALKNTQKIWQNLFLVESVNYSKLSTKSSVRNFHKIN